MLRARQQAIGANAEHRKIGLVDDFDPQTFFVADEANLTFKLLQCRVALQLFFQFVFKLFERFLFDLGGYLRLLHFVEILLVALAAAAFR